MTPEPTINPPSLLDRYGKACGHAKTHEQCEDPHHLFGEPSQPEAVAACPNGVCYIIDFGPKDTSPQYQYPDCPGIILDEEAVLADLARLDANGLAATETAVESTVAHAKAQAGLNLANKELATLRTRLDEVERERDARRERKQTCFALTAEVMGLRSALLSIGEHDELTPGMARQMAHTALEQPQEETARALTTRIKQMEEVVEAARAHSLFFCVIGGPTQPGWSSMNHLHKTVDALATVSIPSVAVARG